MLNLDQLIEKHNFIIGLSHFPFSAWLHLQNRLCIICFNFFANINQPNYFFKIINNKFINNN